MTSTDRPMMPPVRLPAEAELARAALAAPLFAHAAALARWAEAGTRVGAGGELYGEALAGAVERLGLTGEEAVEQAAEAWGIAVDAGLVEIEESGEEAMDDDDPADGVVTGGGAVGLLTQGSPGEVLDLWSAACEAVLADAALPDMSELADQLAEGGELDMDEFEWDLEGEADVLDGALTNLYLLTALESGGDPVPLPALAASLVVPEEMDEPTDEVLGEVSDVMMRLDEQFRLLEPIGLVDYQPVDESLVDEEGPLEDEGTDDEDISRYGLVRLTPLGMYAMRERMLDDGVHAPLVGELADKGADVLLDALPRYTDAAAQAEAEAWLTGTAPVDAARELLAAARGDDPRAPVRRLTCQQILSLAGPDAEPALRDVLDDRELGGLARVWLAEHGAADVPQPDEQMVLWLTVDTIAAQLGRPDLVELADLVEGLVAQHTGFFDRAWRIDHPAVGDVLEAMGRLHPDRAVAKQARKAAFKARSRS
ncbi:hypothetical protein SRB5_24680 [Streptomyces sp. RB5]|uniref:Uncharacterized protein n=1 Tax=Streptomyces smaragdinus TaxID=2585196 RepID=A0A7K0CFT1_9ACTN|nr:hypothetical protein [Streptomyces smaragdinus]MQY12335.1 hypothetical protein [Streptomyces smaragdinus]